MDEQETEREREPESEADRETEREWEPESEADRETAWIWELGPALEADLEREREREQESDAEPGSEREHVQKRKRKDKRKSEREPDAEPGSEREHVQKRKRKGERKSEREHVQERERESERKRSPVLRALQITGFSIADIMILALLLALFACVGAFAATSVSFAVAGVFCARGGREAVVFSVQLPELPYMPRVCAVILGVAICSPAVLFAVVTEYSRLYVTQALRAAIRWNKNFIRRDGFRQPPLPLNPWIGAKKRAVMKVLARASVTVLFVALCAWCLSLLVASMSLTPWSVWSWFD